MSLNTRMSRFFLAALAMVLVGFSLSLYLLARTYLCAQIDDRLNSALDVLNSIVEVKPDGLEFDAADPERRLTIDNLADQVRWIVQTAEGKEVARSSNWRSGVFPAQAAGEAPASWQDLTSSKGEPWRFAQRRLDAAQMQHLVAPPDDEAMDSEDAHDAKYATLILRTGVQTGSVQATLRNLALILTGLSLSILLAAGLLGSALGRRALAPLTQLANSARVMKATETERLPEPGTGDELDDMARAFNDLLVRLQEAYARQARFTGEASHQLRTPLTALLGQVEIALRHPRTSDEYRLVLERVQHQGQHLVRIVEMLLFLARADAETEVLDREVIELNRWLAEALHDWDDHARGVDLRCHTPLQALHARVHPVLLGQLLDNLLDNACKYSKPGSPIEVRLEQCGSQAVLEVNDQGIGIGIEELPHVFEPLFRSPQARHLGLAGAGLGLAIVKRIAEALGGTIRCDSQLGIGTTFVLSLPLHTALPDSAGTMNGFGRTSPTTPAGAAS